MFVQQQISKIFLVPMNELTAASMEVQKKVY